MKKKKSISYEEGLLERLKDPEYAAGYLNECAADDSEDSRALFLTALGRVAKAHGISQLAKEAGVSRDLLYKAFTDSGNPTMKTVFDILDCLDLQLAVQPKKKTG